MGEATDREPIAIAMFESWARTTLANIHQRAAQSVLERIKQKPEDHTSDIHEATLDWYSLSSVTREKWRGRADEMIRESLWGYRPSIRME